MGKDANHTFQPLVPSVAYNPWLGHGEPSELERHAPTLAPGLLSEEECALVNRHCMIHRRFRLVHAFLYATYCI
jgi:hypothetical protein